MKSTSARGELRDFSAPDYFDFVAFGLSDLDLAARMPFKFGVDLGERTDRVEGEFVSCSYFTNALGMLASSGRGFLAHEDAAPVPFAVIRERLWRTRPRSPSYVLGETVRLNGHALTSRGVAPRGFRSVTLPTEKDLWVVLRVSRSS